jgi:4-hydroxybenzoate polyprenyltransferase/phosphoserine phosphatase
MSVVRDQQVTDSPRTKGAAPTLELPPLVVDLDGTLVKTDLLIESLLALLRTKPYYLFILPVWLARGKAWFKHEVARRVSLDVAALPWRNQFIDYLKRQRSEGRLLVLATGTDTRIAQQVADHLKIFDLVLATEPTVNLCGEAKGDLLVSRFGERGFDYAADGADGTENDLTVWRSARKVVLVNPPPQVRNEAARVASIDRDFPEQIVADGKTGLAARLRALRPAHWLKNLLVLVPVFAAHRFHDFASLEKSLLAFVAFGCCASSGYLFNDLIDLEADRHHPRKKSRPFAAGDLPLTYAIGMIPALLASGSILAAMVSPLLLAMLLAYFVLSAVYSIHVKRIAVLDVLFLAGLYSVRIMAGSAAVGIWSSHWLLAFSIFLFFSLALVKRYGELVIKRRTEGEGATARAYELSDGELLAAMGIASGYLAVLVLALYIASDKAGTLYARRELLWFLCPLLLYWISHVWLTAHRGKMHDDPVVFATTDRTSRILLFLIVATAVVSV